MEDTIKHFVIKKYPQLIQNKKLVEFCDNVGRNHNHNKSYKLRSRCDLQHAKYSDQIPPTERKMLQNRSKKLIICTVEESFARYNQARAAENIL